VRTFTPPLFWMERCAHGSRPLSSASYCKQEGSYVRLGIMLRKRLRALERRRREVRMFAAAMRYRTRPVVAQIVPIRRCNLACTYCNEFDHSSQPVPLPEMLARVDKLANLGASVVTISGGEPLLHPQLEEIIRRIRSHGAIATLITNAYLLSPQRIRRLN